MVEKTFAGVNVVLSDWSLDESLTERQFLIEMLIEYGISDRIECIQLKSVELVGARFSRVKIPLLYP